MDRQPLVDRLRFLLAKNVRLVLERNSSWIAQPSNRFGSWRTTAWRVSSDGPVGRRRAETSEEVRHELELTREKKRRGSDVTRPAAGLPSRTARGKLSVTGRNGTTCRPAAGSPSTGAEGAGCPRCPFRGREREFGDYQLEDFAFTFAGEEDKGTVSITHKQKRLPGLRVIKEKNAWKVDER
jgi:hypothetical protein